MKSLRFLISSQPATFPDKLLAALEATGHTAQKAEQTSSHSDISFLPDNYDYLIEIDPFLPDFPVPTLTFGLEKTDRALLKLSIFLKKNNKFFSSNLMNVDFCHTDSENFYTQLTDSFMDIVLDLARDDDTNWKLVSALAGRDLFDQIIALDRQSAMLNKVYAMAGYEEKFSLSSPGTVKQTIHARYTATDIRLSETDAELLLVYLLLLLNSRRHAVYQYDHGKDTKIITKCIEVDRSCTYAALTERINHPAYNIRQNVFSESFYHPTERSDVLLTVEGANKIIQSLPGQYALWIDHDAINQQLHIHYRDDVCFFREVADYLRYFTQKFPVWKNTSAAIQDLLYTDVSLYKKQLYEWNQTRRPYPQDQTIHSLFEAQARHHPENTALICAGRKLSYQELNTRADRLAHCLCSRLNPRPDDLIGLFLYRNEWMPTAMLAVLKSGAAYVPVDPKAPEERIQHMLRDTQVKAVITHSAHRHKLQQLFDKLELNVDIFDETDSVASPPAHTTIDAPPVSSSNLAYVLYTSGSTGTPKGVMVEHKNVVNLICEQIRLFNLASANPDQQKHCLWYANYVFDAHVWELYAALASGNIVHLIDDSIRMDRKNLAEYIQAQSIDIATLTPSLLIKSELLDIKILVMAGEAPNPEVVTAYLEKGVTVINAYGPTETTVCATVRICDQTNSSNNIGRPIANMSCYVLDEQQQPLPIGTVGELYVGGAGIARGYWHADHLTRTNFIPNPFNQAPDSPRLYRTGDLVKILPDGSFDYLGRCDHQVKIRGHRVELEEIEIQLNSYPDIQQSVVLPIANHSSKTFQGLIGYYVAQAPVAREHLLSYLDRRLPGYMVPQFLIHLPALPVNASGKLDRNALPSPYSANTNQDVHWIENSAEAKLMQLFSLVLGMKSDQKINWDDDFFTLGGTSILAMELVTAINQAFDIDIRSAVIFTHPTVRKLARFLSLQETTLNLITKLNTTTCKINLFMIHPGMSGTEVYLSLAKRLTGQYSCYGLDNYNLNHKIKITDLNELAQVYLSEIDKVRQQTKQTDQPYLLSGWSIGGLIALKVARLLEERGNCAAVQVILFDTFLLDDKLLAVLRYDFSALHGFLRKMGHSEDHIQKIIRNIDCENQVIRQSLNIGQLTATQILLFKAMQSYDIGILIGYTDETDAYLTGLPYNNLDIISHPGNVTVVKFHNVNHSRICQEEDAISDKLEAWRYSHCVNES